MLIITKYGKIDLDDLDEYDLSEKTRDYIKSQITAAEIFFSNEITLDDDDKFADEIQEIASAVVAEIKFDEPERVFALLEVIDVDINYIQQEGRNNTAFIVEGDNSYLVLTDAEATELAVEYAESYLDDVGIEGLSESSKRYVYENFVNTHWLDDMMEESNRSYADDLENDRASSSEFINRLHEEMFEKSIMDEPEWPTEDDFEIEFERDEFEEPEPEQDDFSDQDEYAQALETWTQAKQQHEEQQDQLEQEHESNAADQLLNAREEYQRQLEQQVEDNKDDFVEHLNDQYDNGVDYYIQNFGEKELEELVVDNNLVDMVQVAQWMVEMDGRGQLLASYDGSEDYVNFTFKGQNYEFYVYRTN
jgi:hypothetical protein